MDTLGNSTYDAASARSADSLGVMLESLPMNTRHPLYKVVSTAVKEKLTEMSMREDVRVSSLARVLVSNTLDSEQRQFVARSFPEFTMVNYGLNRPAHVVFQTARMMMNEVMVHQTSEYAEHVVHAGASMLNNILNGRHKTYLVADPVNAFDRHRRHAESVDVHRVFSDFSTLVADFPDPVWRSHYEDYLNAKSYQVVPQSILHGIQAEAMIWDLTVHAISPMQVAAAMLESGATLSTGIYLYHPTMLVNAAGTFPGADIAYERVVKDGSECFLFKYPEGVAGVTSYSVDLWHAWTTAHTLDPNPKSSWVYQMELVSNRLWFMQFRIVRVPRKGARADVIHALDTPFGRDYYLVKSWKLRDLVSDPKDQQSWLRNDFMAPCRLVDRAFEHAMQLEPTMFNKYVIRTRLQYLNDRTTIKGTEVQVAPPLSPTMLDQLTVAVYARAFVERYNTGKLVTEMMQELKRVNGFVDMPIAQKVLFVASHVVQDLWQATFGSFIDSCSDFVDGLVRQNTLPVSIVRAPEYVRVTEAFTSSLSDAMTSVASDIRYKDFGIPAIVTVPGGWLFEAVKSRFQAAVQTEDDCNGLEDVLANFSRDIEDMRVPGAEAAARQDSLRSSVLQHVASVNTMVRSNFGRHMYDVTKVVRVPAITREMKPDQIADPDPISTLNSVYMATIPGVALSSLDYDTASISLDPQDRVFETVSMRLPNVNDIPRNRSFYHSKIRALNVPKRQNTMQETLSALVGRNLGAPQIAAVQDYDTLIPEIWDNFVQQACVADAPQRLLKFQEDPVELSIEQYEDWMQQASSDSLLTLRGKLEQAAMVLESRNVADYEFMLKADVKPTLSTKPVLQHVDPQVIVHHTKDLGSLYSSIMRVLVRRFLSILKPNIHINLLKDTTDMSQFISGIHPFHKTDLKYLENDFSQYDKSQGSFAFLLEHYVLEKLGMNQALLDRWLDGHVKCNIRSITLGLCFSVLYQRKSGDATTAFGNVLLNSLSVFYAYKGTSVIWALFMGDDSIICTNQVVVTDAPQILAEVFNLSAKFFVTSAPYFASNFIMLRPDVGHAVLLPDPIKRIERWSMHIDGKDPAWDERYQSLVDTCAPYAYTINTNGLPRMLAERYGGLELQYQGIAQAVYAVVASRQRFRDMWEELPRSTFY